MHELSLIQSPLPTTLPSSSSHLASFGKSEQVLALLTNLGLPLVLLVTVCWPSNRMPDGGTAESVDSSNAIIVAMRMLRGAWRVMVNVVGVGVGVWI